MIREAFDTSQLKVFVADVSTQEALNVISSKQFSLFFLITFLLE